jgi:hypothetical protein
MGSVHRARDRATGREVALKLMLRASNAESRERFLREGQLTAGLRHPGIVAVHSAGECQGVPYLAYELVPDARTFADVLAEEPLGSDRALDLLAQAAEALGHAHAAGVVHRDVKPENLLVDAEGRLKVADFGVASAADLERLTQTGAIVGTPHYMSPEQLFPDQPLSPATDVWALGVILYEVLTGERPFKTDQVFELMTQVRSGAPPVRRANPEAHRALAALCDRALHSTPQRRPAGGAAFAAALRSARAERDAGVSAGPPRALLAAGLATLLLGAAAAFALWGPDPAKAPPEVAPPSRGAAALPEPATASADHTDSHAGSGRSAASASLARARSLRRGRPAALWRWLRAHPDDARQPQVTRELDALAAKEPLATLPHVDAPHHVRVRLWTPDLLTTTGPDRASTWRLPGLERADLATVSLRTLARVDQRWLLNRGHLEWVDDAGERTKIPGSVALTKLEVLPDGETLLTWTTERAVRVAIQGGEVLTTYLNESPTRVRYVTLAPDGKTVVVGRGDHYGGEVMRNGLIQTFDLQTGEQRARVPTMSPIMQIVFAPNQALGAYATARGGVHLCDLEFAHVARLAGPDDDPARDSALVVEAHDAATVGVAFSPDGATLVSAGLSKRSPARGHLRVWQVDTRRLRSSAPLLAPPADLSLSPNGRLAAVGFQDGTAQVWWVPALD